MIYIFEQKGQIIIIITAYYLSIQNMIKSNRISFSKEEEAVSAVLQAEQEVRECKIYKGDLRDLAKKFK